MNQQKFYFILQEDETVSARASIGFYTHVDLGIAAYHFERVNIFPLLAYNNIEEIKKYFSFIQKGLTNLLCSAII